MQRYSLLQLNNILKQAIEDGLPQTYWVEAEIGSIGESRGHLYLEIIEKRDGSNTPIAKASAKCWANVWQPLKYDFLSVTGAPLAQGMKVLLQVYAQFHPAYGFSWIITDIDATYTLGDMARGRQEIIAQLKEMGIFDDQKSLTLPMFCQRIAVISSASAAGYGDFSDQLMNNAHGFVFKTELFPAIMQGENVEKSIIEQLDRINDRMQDFDCVVIIRGGGATSDLSGFDTLDLSANVAQFPLPVITGIGHERDESILDLVAHVSVKTPTAVAEFLINRLLEVSSYLNDITDNIRKIVAVKLENERLRLNTLTTRIPVVFSLIKERQSSRLDNINVRIRNALRNRLTQEHHRHELLQQRCKAVDPQKILNRGYSMTLLDGHVITDASQLKQGDVIQTRFANGNSLSKVQ